MYKSLSRSNNNMPATCRRTYNARLIISCSQKSMSSGIVNERMTETIESRWETCTEISYYRVATTTRNLHKCNTEPEESCRTTLRSDPKNCWETANFGNHKIRKRQQTNFKRVSWARISSQTSEHARDIHSSSEAPFSAWMEIWSIFPLQFAKVEVIS